MIERLPVRIPAGAAEKFSSPESSLCADSYSVPVPGRVTAVARKRPRSFCQKRRWQVTPKHACTLDPTKSEWADYAALSRHSVGTYRETSSLATCQGAFGHGRLISLSHCKMMLA